MNNKLKNWERYELENKPTTKEKKIIEKIRKYDQQGLTYFLRTDMLTGAPIGITLMSTIEKNIKEV